MIRLPFRPPFAAAAAAAFLSASAFAAAPPSERASTPVPAVEFRTEPASIAGEIVDCSSYILMGRRGPDTRTLQAHNIDAGMPACLVAQDGQVYLLLSPAGHPRDKFQPTESFLGGGTIVQGALYQRGALKALTIDRVDRANSRLRHNAKKDLAPRPQDDTNQGGAGIIK